MRKCVFFDRDGVVNRSPGAGYVLSWDAFHLQSGFVSALRVVTELGYAAVIITNQQCVSKGLITVDGLACIHAQLRRELEREYGLTLLDVMVCPHGDVHNCECRKPKPGMILEAARRHAIDLASSWMVGDQERDIVCGHVAGCRTVLVSDGACSTAADIHLRDLADLEHLLRRVLQKDTLVSD